MRLQSRVERCGISWYQIEPGSISGDNEINSFTGGISGQKHGSSRSDALGHPTFKVLVYDDCVSSGERWPCPGRPKPRDAPVPSLLCMV